VLDDLLLFLGLLGLVFSIGFRWTMRRAPRERDRNDNPR
jgi:prepilin signal peptidase PulO-like enzyme (type II secretory pathway)